MPKNPEQPEEESKDLESIVSDSIKAQEMADLDIPIPEAIVAAGSGDCFLIVPQVGIQAALCGDPTAGSCRVYGGVAQPG